MLTACGWEMFIFLCGIFIGMTSIYPKGNRVIEYGRGLLKNPSLTFKYYQRDHDNLEWDQHGTFIITITIIIIIIYCHI